MRSFKTFSDPRISRYSAIRRWISASSSRIFCCSMPVRRCNCSSMMACACFSVNSKRAIRPSRASRGLAAAPELIDDAHAVSIALIADLGDAFEALVIDQRGGGFDQARLVHLVGNLGDDDLLAILPHRLGEGFGAQFEVAAPVEIRVANPLLSQNEA